MYRFFYNRTEVLFFFLVMVPVFLLSSFVSIRMQFIYKKFFKIKSISGVTGAVVARNILDSYGLHNVRIEPISGYLTDHYDPRDDVVRLSYNNYEGCSIASIGVVAHEVGHAIQHANAYFPVKIRSLVVPMTNFGSFLSMPIFVIGLMFSNYKLAFLGIILFSLIVVFELVTLPVEFDASARAIKILKNQKILNFEEVGGVKKVLWAAAMTYVASFLSALVQLIRLVLIFISSQGGKDGGSGDD